MGPINGTLPRRAPSQYETQHKGWGRWYMAAFTVSASALLATLVTFVILSLLLNDASFPAAHGPQHNSMLPRMRVQQAATVNVSQAAADASLTGSGNRTAQAPKAVTQPVQPPPKAAFIHPFPELKGYYKIPSKDTSPRCVQSQICDGDHSCGVDKLGCVTTAEDRKQHVRSAIAWAWDGYRKFAWGHDEVDIVSKSPHAWFKLGLTIVDSLDTLLLAGLAEEYQQARHWVANHLQFQDGSNVQFFEVNIRILGGLLSAYYLSDGDDMYLHKAQQLADRLMVAFNTSSGIPKTFVQLADAAGRRSSYVSDVQTNQAEAGTISMEFTTAGRLLGRDDMFDAANHFWYVLMSSQNFSGIYCMGIHTSNGHCTDPKITIGSAADSMYEYMLKQWLLSGKQQKVPLMLYKEAMHGVRKHLVRHVYDGSEEMSFVSEATADQNSGKVSPPSDRFEHLTCFAGGMFVLGKLNNISTALDNEDYDDLVLGARIGKACYELYHQAASGLAPDSVHYHQANGQALPTNDISGLSPAKINAMRVSKVQAPQSQHVPDTRQVTGEPTPQPPSVTIPDASGAPKRITQPRQDQLHQEVKNPAAVNSADRPRPQALVPQGLAPDTAPDASQGTSAVAQQPHDDKAPTSDKVKGKGVSTNTADTADHAAGIKPVESETAGLTTKAPADAADGGTGQQQAAAAGTMTVDSAVAGRPTRRLMAEEEDQVPADTPADAGGAAGAEQELDVAVETEGDGQDSSDDDTAADRSPDPDDTDTSPDEEEPDSDSPANAAADGDEDQAVGEGGNGASPSLPSPSSPSSPPHPPPPPPPGPVIAKWTQLSNGDFLRPETVETLFYLWRATGDEVYREWGWNMFRAFERWTRLPQGGYATVNNVNTVPPPLANKMESFWLAETLKYFYLLFEDDPSVVNFDEWVLNTEAHPLPIWGSPADVKARTRLAERRHAAVKAKQRQEAELSALQGMEELQAQTRKARQDAPKGAPHEREGYGLAGLDME